jgi:hypothetical protein
MLGLIAKKRTLLRPGRLEEFTAETECLFSRPALIVASIGKHP